MSWVSVAWDWYAVHSDKVNPVVAGLGAAGDAVWCCDGCGRPASLTQDEWHAQRAAAEAVRAVQAAAAAAAAPKPRDALQEAQAARAEAVARLAKLEPGLEAARAALASALVRHDAATAAVQEAEAGAIQRLAASVMGTRPATSDAPTTGAARGQLRIAEDGLTASRGAKALIDEHLIDARRAANIAEANVRTAALHVLANEALEGLLETAINARASYLESIGGLSWLIRNHAVPNGDARAHQLVLEGDSAPAKGSRGNKRINRKAGSESPPCVLVHRWSSYFPASPKWPEALYADGGMATKLAALMGGGGSASI